MLKDRNRSEVISVDYNRGLLTELNYISNLFHDLDNIDNLQFSELIVTLNRIQATTQKHNRLNVNAH